MSDDKNNISGTMRLLALNRSPTSRKGREAREWTCPLCSRLLGKTRLFRSHLREAHDVHWRLVIANGALLPKLQMDKNLERYRRNQEKRGAMK
jgi:hypothetical protein